MIPLRLSLYSNLDFHFSRSVLQAAVPLVLDHNQTMPTMMIESIGFSRDFASQSKDGISLEFASTENALASPHA
jgi:hypothetical protein